MKNLSVRSRFKKDLKRVTKRKLPLDKLETLLDLLTNDQPLPATYKDHPLKGEWIGWRECHIEPDWLLIYKTNDDEVLLARTGSHTDLFE